MLGETCSANTLLDMANPFGCESAYFMGVGASTPYLIAISATVQPTANIGIGA